MIPLFNSIFLMAAQVQLSAIDPGKPLADSPKQFIQELFPTMIKVIAGLAILAIAYWGIMYTLSNVAGIKGVSKDRMWSIIQGLLLALAAYIILQTINPDIIKTLNCFFGGGPNCQ